MIEIRIVIYLDDILIIGRTREETTVVLLLHSLGFVINQKKSVITPVQEIEIIVISGNHSQFKGNDYFPSAEKNTINKTDVSGSASESKDNSFRVNKGVTSPEKLHCRFLQQQQIQAPKKNGF